MYAKYFGMDPSEILFNDNGVPLEGTVNFKGEPQEKLKKIVVVNLLNVHEIFIDPILNA